MGDRSRPPIRSRLGEVLLAVFFALTPSEVPAWRADPAIRPVAVLAVGDPMTPLPVRGGVE